MDFQKTNSKKSSTASNKVGDADGVFMTGASAAIGGAYYKNLVGFKFALKLAVK